MGFEDLPVPLDGVFARCARDVYAPLDTKGARLLGGRFNPPGLPALYLASSPEAALLESTNATADAEFRAFAPRRLVCVRVNLSAVIDFTVPDAQSSVGLSPDDLVEAWAHALELTKTQEYGDNAYRAGIEAIRYPSRVVPDAANIAVFVDNLLSSSSLRVIEEDER